MDVHTFEIYIEAAIQKVHSYLPEVKHVKQHGNFHQIDST